MITAKKIALHLKNYIVDHGLEPGDRLPTHRELREHLNIGDRCLREGLSILNQYGIVETRRRGGTRVGKPKVQDLAEPISWHFEINEYDFADIVRARAALESAMAAEAAKARTRRDLLEMTDIIEEMDGLMDPFGQSESADQAYHVAILRAANNPAILFLGRLLAVAFDRKSREHIVCSEDRLAQSKVEHRGIYRSIEMHDPDAARQQMYEHIMGQLKEIW